MMRQFERLAAEAAADRARAAEDRARAARDRTSAANERARMEDELRMAHLDELTGAYRREMGRLALSHEIDSVLQSVVLAMRSNLRSFDPIIRYGGDEFVCGLGGTDLGEAERRFELIGVAIEADTGVGISVGLAALELGDTAERLTERADAAMLEVRATHHSRQ